VIAHTTEDRTGLLYLICLWAVVWSACVTVSLLGENEANWVAPAHVAVIVLISWWLDDSIVWTRIIRVRLSLVAWSLVVVLITALQHTEWIYPVAARFCPEPTADRPAPMRRFDPTCRMRGYRELRPEVEARLAALRAVVAAWEVSICRDYRGPQDVEHTRELLKTFATPRYYAAQGGSPRGFVQGMYRDLLGRSATPPELDAWLRLIANHPRDTVVAQMIASEEYRLRRREMGRRTVPDQVASRRDPGRLR
jgi:hypothetical protein